MVYIWGKWFQYQKMKGKPRKSLYKELWKKGVARRRLFPNEFWLEIFYGVYWYPGATHEHCFLLIWLKKWFLTRPSKGGSEGTMGGIRSVLICTKGGMAFYHSDLFWTQMQKGHKRCMRGAREGHERCMRGVREVYERGTSGVREGHEKGTRGAREVHKRCTHGH